MTRRISVFTGTRADYGHLAPLMRAIAADPRLELKILASGAHLAPEFGETWREIEADGFTIAEKVDMLLAADSPVAVAKSMALCLMGCAEALDRMKPDLLVVLGDRYEALAAAEAALLLRIPIAHIHGGEATFGAIDDSMRHAITKMASLHFVAAEDYRRRVLQMGEAPERVFNVGAPGLDVIASATLADWAEFQATTGFRPGKVNLIVTYHPATAGAADPASAAEALLAALDRFPETHVVLTKANADAGGRAINEKVEAWAAARPGRALCVASLGQRLYLSALELSDAVLGNTSSGIIEAPALGCPTVNIGPRQDGRARAPSVIDCAEDADAIAAAIARALTPEMREIAGRRESPYGTGGASTRIKDVLATADLSSAKRFRDMAGHAC